MPTVRMQQHELCFVDHIPRCKVNSSCSNSSLQWWRSRSAWTSNLPPDYVKEQTSSLASLEARWPAEQASRNVRRFVPCVRECISMATLVCAHGTAILTNRGPSKLVAECIFYALQVRTWTIRKMIVWKIFFVVYNNSIIITAFLLIFAKSSIL